MSAEYILVPTAAGASRLYLGNTTKAMVSEHRDWLREAHHELADEAPGVLKLIGADGAVKRAVSGWALGGPLPGGEVTWVEEAGEEYHYRIASTGGAGVVLSPPEDFWVVAAAVGHTASPLSAVVLWRPLPGGSARDPKVRRDELWIAAVDRATGVVKATTQLALTLPWDRAQGVALGGTAAAPILLLAGLPDPGGPGAYPIVGLRLPTLEIAWKSSVDVAAEETARAAARPASPRASEPLPPGPALTGDALRTLYAFLIAPMGDGSGWLFDHGGPVGRILVSDLAFQVANDGKVTPLRQLHLPGTNQLGPILDEPGVFVLGKEGARNEQHFVSVDAVYPGTQRRQTLVDQRTQVHGRALGTSPELIPMSAAIGGGVVFAAPPIGGEGLGADSADVRGLQPTPSTWHQTDRPRVRARQQWLDERTRR